MSDSTFLLNSDVFVNVIVPKLDLKTRFGSLALVSQEMRKLVLSSPLPSLELGEIPDMAMNFYIKRNEIISKLRRENKLWGHSSETAKILEEFVTEFFSSSPFMRYAPIKSVEQLSVGFRATLTVVEVKALVSFFPNLRSLKLNDVSHTNIQYNPEVNHMEHTGVLGDDFDMTPRNALASLPHLTKLMIYRYAIKPNFFLDFSHLTELRISCEMYVLFDNETFKQLTDSIRKAKNLTSLSVNFTLPSDLDLPNLKSLYCNIQHHEDGEDAFSLLKSPTCANLENLGLVIQAQSLPHLTMQNLKLLTLDFYEGEIDSVPSYDLPSLTQLAINSSEPFPILKKFRSSNRLERLVIDDEYRQRPITDDDLEFLANFPRLTHLLLKGVFSIGKLAQVFKKFHPNIVSVELGQLGPIDDGPVTTTAETAELFASLDKERVAVIDLGLIPISVDSMKTLATFKKLRRFENNLLPDFEVSDEWIAPILELPELENIHVDRPMGGGAGKVSKDMLTKIKKRFPNATHVDLVGLTEMEEPEEELA